MVTDFWAWKHATRACVLVWLGQDYGAGLIQDGAHESLKSTGRVGGLIIYHGVMFKVELD